MPRLNRSPDDRCYDWHSQSRSMTACGMSATASRSPTASATDVLPDPTVPVISNACDVTLSMACTLGSDGHMGSRSSTGVHDACLSHTGPPSPVGMAALASHRHVGI